MKLGSVFLFAVSMFAEVAAFADQSFPRLADKIQQQVRSNITACGRLIVDLSFETSPNFASALIDASYGVFDQNGRPIGYFVQSFEGNPHFRWISPRQDYVHSIVFTTNFISLSLPDLGTVAEGNRFVNPQGVQFNYRCKSVGRVNSLADFETCIAREFVNRVSERICKI
ncbi:MAG: hypothetical protein NT027_14245 [Proteobacteria bacterium]|nr:hypothetical protein [Pseudomonadota bacterium]